MIRLTLLSLFLLMTIQLTAQKRFYSGNLIFLLGPDTTMAGSYLLKEDGFDIKVLSRPNVTVTRLTGTLFPNGELQTAEGNTYKPVPGKDSQLISTTRLYVTEDSTFIEVTRGKEVTMNRFSGHAMTANAIGPPFRFLLPFATVYAPSKIGDSVISGHLTLGTTKKYVLKRIAADKVTAGSTVMGTLTIGHDKNKDVTYIDGIGSSSNIKGVVVKRLDLDALARQFALQELDHTGISVINQLDSVQETIGNGSFKVVYSRPKVRGRVIFGSVVPYDRFWRTGANAATRLVMDKPIYLEGKKLDAGEYSLWTLPTANGWTMMFNSKANTWGTEYNPSFDVLRVPMQVSKLEAPIELMTIEIKPSASGGVLNVIWEKTKASVNFTLTE